MLTCCFSDLNLTGGEIVWLDKWVVQRVGALQLHPADTGASHWSHVNLQHGVLSSSVQNVLLSRWVLNQVHRLNVNISQLL